MGDFSLTSQWSSWTFLSSDLDATRARRFEDGQRRRAAAAATALDGSLPSSAKRARGAAPGAGDSPHQSGGSGPRRPPLDAAALPLSLAEELALLRAYELDIQRACGAIPFDRAIMATAVTFFKRFYLTACPTEYPPSDIV